jgi:transcriptional regulator with XRE-family HTH domain
MKLLIWRKSQGLTLADAAQLFGIEGTNPARTLQRFETGERMPTALTIAAIEVATDHLVTAQDIYEVRLAWERANASAAVAE